MSVCRSLRQYSGTLVGRGLAPAASPGFRPHPTRATARVAPTPIFWDVCRGDPCGRPFSVFLPCPTRAGKPGPYGRSQNPPVILSASEGSRILWLRCSVHGILRRCALLSLPQSRFRACFTTARKAARLRKLRSAFLCPRQRRPAILRMTGGRKR